MITEKQLRELPIPKWCGEPMYPGGWPMQKVDIRYSGRNIQDIYHDYLDCVVIKKKKPNQDDVDYLRYFMFYYIHAPIFKNEFTEDLRNRVHLKMSLDELVSLCMEFGMDPL